MEYSASNLGNLVLVLMLVINWTPFAKAADNNDGLGASFIFGDSLVDAGNNNYLQTLSRANMVPNGIDFKASGGNPTGRYTNGRTIGDIVGTSIYIYIMMNSPSLCSKLYIHFCNNYKLLNSLFHHFR